MKLKTMLASLMAVSMLTACEDLFEDGSLQPDGSKPSLTVNNPTKNQSVSAAQGLRLNITAVDKDKLKNLDVVLQSQSSEKKSVITFKKLPPQENIIEFDTTLNLNGVAPGAYNLIIKATDNRTNVSVEEVFVNVK